MRLFSLNKSKHPLMVDQGESSMHAVPPQAGKCVLILGDAVIKFLLISIQETTFDYWKMQATILELSRRAD